MDYSARWYGPSISRFVSADTIVHGAGNPQTLNRYAYVLGNPLRYHDITGNYFCEALDLCEPPYRNNIEPEINPFLTQEIEAKTPSISKDLELPGINGYTSRKFIS